MKQGCAWLAFSFSFLLLAGCGFHLRGEVPIDASVAVDQQKASALGAVVLTQFRQSAVQIVDDPSKADLVLVLMKEHQTKTAMSTLNAYTGSGTYTVAETVEYRIESAQGKTLVGPDRLTATKDVQLSGTQASSIDQAFLNQLREDIAVRLLWRLQSVDEHAGAVDDEAE